MTSLTEREFDRQLAEQTSRLAELTLRETAQRLMRVRGRSFTVPAEFRRLMTDSLIPGVINVSRWWILSDFAIDGTGLRQIEGLYRLRNGEAKLVVEDALHTLEEMTQ